MIIDTVATADADIIATIVPLVESPAPVTIPIAPPVAVATPSPNGKDRGERLTYVEPIRAYAMSIVVFIHVAAILAPHYNTIRPDEWWVANFYHVLSKGGPPIFTIVSGALLLGISKDQPLAEFFRKRFMKVLVPFLGWACVYLGWRVMFKGETMALDQMIGAILGGSVYDHMWFIQMILGLYLATPVLRVYVQNATRDNLRYFLIVWFIGVASLPTISRLLNMNIKADLVVMTGYTGYFLAGYYLRTVTLNARQAIQTLVIVVLMILFTQYATYALTMTQKGVFDGFFLNNQGFNIFIIAAGIFLFLKSLPWTEIYSRYPLVKRTILLLASCSLGVYFVHVLIMELLGSGRLGFSLSHLTIHPLIGIPLTALVTLVLSVLTVMGLKRIPVLKIFVP